MKKGCHRNLVLLFSLLFLLPLTAKAALPDNFHELVADGATKAATSSPWPLIAVLMLIVAVFIKSKL